MHILLLIGSCWFIYWIYTKTSKFVFLNFLSEPIYKKTHYYWNIEKQQWDYIPQHEISRKFSLDMTLNWITFIGFLILVTYLFKFL